MKILYFTNCFPVESNPANGIFTYQRMVELLRKNIQVHVLGYKFTASRKHYYKFLLNSLVKKNKNTLKSICPLDPRISISTILVLGDDRFPNYKFSSSSTLDRISKELYKEYKISGSQLIHVHFLWYAYPAYLLKKKYGIPYVITLHGSDIHESPFISEQNKKDAITLLNNADHLIFVSRFLLEKSREFGFSGDNVSVIPNGFDERVFNIKQVERSDSYSTVGFVGSIVVGKGILLLPEIFYHISKTVSEIKFLIVGNGPEKKAFVDLLNKFNILDKVTFAGKVHPEKVAGYMKQMDVLVLPSYNEGFPCVLIEAQACGVRVVASENGGTVEATRHTGRIVPNGQNYESRFAETIIELLNKKINSREVQDSVKDYTWSRIVDREIEVYEKTVHRLLV